ncbi:MAG: S-layer homology domain-containing protein [Candidatus Atribacteria bacterium]|nr:S-layer homology domain-containing protein [Candidatus Atribacteria bacterium]
MKKLALALVLVFAFALPALANPFVDVPLNHWAYDAVQSLAAKGVIIGYPDGTFGGNRALTRYEFAMAIARAIGYLESKIDEAGFATQEDLATLEKLIKEFADELKNLGVTVDDLKKVVGENSEAIKALEARVAELEKYAEPVKVTGEFTSTWEAFLPTAAGKTNVSFSDSTTLYIAATINEYTTAGVDLTIDDTFSTPSVSADNFYIEYQKDEWYVKAGDQRLGKIGLGLVLGDYQPDDPDDDRDYDLDFEGAYVKYAPEDSDITWKALAAPNDWYSVRAEWEKVGVGVTWMPEGASLWNANSDLIISADAWTDFDESDVKLTIEGAYGVLSGSYGVAGEVAIKATEDVTITLDGHYVTAGFTPATSAASPSGFDANELGFGVAASFDLSGEDAAEKWTLDVEYDYAQTLANVATTNEVSGTITYVPEEPAEGEEGKIKVTYDLLTNGITVYGAYLNYPLDLDSENNEAYISVGGEYNMAAAAFTLAGKLDYKWLDKNTTLTVEGRYDSAPAAGAPVYSVLAELGWDMAENTTLTVSYELNTWDAGDDFGQGDIIDGAGTITAELSVSF